MPRTSLRVELAVRGASYLKLGRELQVEEAAFFVSGILTAVVDIVAHEVDFGFLVRTAHAEGLHVYVEVIFAVGKVGCLLGDYLEPEAFECISVLGFGYALGVGLHKF